MPGGILCGDGNASVCSNAFCCPLALVLSRSCPLPADNAMGTCPRRREQFPSGRPRTFRHTFKSGTMDQYSSYYKSTACALKAKIRNVCVMIYRASTGAPRPAKGRRADSPGAESRQAMPLQKAGAASPFRVGCSGLFCGDVLPLFTGMAVLPAPSCYSMRISPEVVESVRGV